MQNLQELPKLTDSLGFLYVEHAILEKSDSSVEAITREGRIPIPISTITCLVLGPGTTITHAAIQVITEVGCMVLWTGEGLERFYATGMGETRSAKNLLVQARCCMDDYLHMKVVRKMYSMRFSDIDTENLTLQQIRGMEGIRVRTIYKEYSDKSGVPWLGRSYKQTSWNNSDDINKAISQANSLLYGLCHSAIISLGYNAGLGFIHIGKLMSFVYDIADLYKTETTIPVAFEAVGTNQTSYSQIRKICRKYFYNQSLPGRIAKDLAEIFNIADNEEQDNMNNVGRLWDDQELTVEGGINYETGDVK